jgi:predicted extracellular nuclease
LEIRSDLISYGRFMTRGFRSAAVTAACAAAVLFPAGLASATATAPAAGLSIHTILGPGHLSPYAGQAVSGVPGVVTDVTSSSFDLQDPARVGGTPFKQAIEVYTGKKPTVVAGDDVTVSGTVSEFYPDQADTPSALPIAEIDSPTVTVTSTGNPLPAPVVIGARGVLPPAQDIYGGRTSTDVTTDSTFKPTQRALDFYSGLDSEYVQVEDPVAIGPTNDFAFAVAPDNGAGAGLRTPAGGLADFSNASVNSRRLAVYAPDGISAPTVNVGDHFSGPVEGVMTEYEGNPELDLTASVTGVSHGLTPQVAPAPRAGQLSVATYNLDNLSPKTAATKFTSLGQQIVTNLRSPDILAVQEIQDNDGATDDGVVAADVTLGDLVSAIQAAGGPAYSWTEIDPVNDQDGGQPGGNIRQVILYRTDVGLTFDSIPGGGSTVADSVTGHGASTALAQSPGRVDPANPAFAAGQILTWPGSTRTSTSGASRKPLAAQFTFHGHTIFVINNHLDAKLADDADFGRYQPPILWSEVQRDEQAQVLHSFVTSIEKADPSADVITLGDLNDQGFSKAFHIMESGNALVDTVSRLPLNQQYDYVFDGDSEGLSGLLVSPALARVTAHAAPVHINAEFAGQTSDHDPLLADFAITGK